VILNKSVQSQFIGAADRNGTLIQPTDMTAIEPRMIVEVSRLDETPWFGLVQELDRDTAWISELDEVKGTFLPSDEIQQVSLAHCHQSPAVFPILPKVCIEERLDTCSSKKYAIHNIFVQTASTLNLGDSLILLANPTGTLIDTLCNQSKIPKDRIVVSTCRPQDPRVAGILTYPHAVDIALRSFPVGSPKFAAVFFDFSAWANWTSVECLFKGEHCAESVTVGIASSLSDVHHLLKKHASQHGYRVDGTQQLSGYHQFLVHRGGLEKRSLPDESEDEPPVAKRRKAPETKERILVGDNVAVLRAHPEIKCDLVITSPPYMLDHQDTMIFGGAGKMYEEFDDGGSYPEYIAKSVALFQELNLHVADRGVVLYNLSYGHKNPSLPAQVIVKIEESTPWRLVDTIHWKKPKAFAIWANSHSLTRISESIYVFAKVDHTRDFHTNKKPTTVLRNNLQVYTSLANFIEAPNSDPRIRNDCPTKATFSTELVCKLLDMYAPEDAVVLDPFMGSGTTPVACIDRGFGYYGIDVSEKAVEFARARIRDHQQPSLLQSVQMDESN